MRCLLLSFSLTAARFDSTKTNAEFDHIVSDLVELERNRIYEAYKADPSDGPSTGPSHGPWHANEPSDGPWQEAASTTTQAAFDRGEDSNEPSEGPWADTTPDRRAPATLKTTGPTTSSTSTSTTTIMSVWHGVKCKKEDCPKLMNLVNASHRAKQEAFHSVQRVLHSLDDRLRGNEPFLAESTAREAFEDSEFVTLPMIKHNETFKICREKLQTTLAQAKAEHKKRLKKKLEHRLHQLEHLQKTLTEDVVKELRKQHASLIRARVRQADKAANAWKRAAKKASKTLKKAGAEKPYYERLKRRAKVVSRKWEKGVDQLADADKDFSMSFYEDLLKQTHERIDAAYHSNPDDDTGFGMDDDGDAYSPSEHSEEDMQAEKEEGTEERQDEEKEESLMENKHRHRSLNCDVDVRAMLLSLSALPYIEASKEHAEPGNATSSWMLMFAGVALASLTVWVVASVRRPRRAEVAAMQQPLLQAEQSA